jgi:hypothetical protein
MELVIVTRPRRVFVCSYECDACSPFGSEWTTELNEPRPDYCPRCDRQYEPYAVDEVTEDRPEFDEVEL